MTPDPMTKRITRDAANLARDMERLRKAIAERDELNAQLSKSIAHLTDKRIAEEATDRNMAMTSDPGFEYHDPVMNPTLVENKRLRTRIAELKAECDDLRVRFDRLTR